MTKNEIREALSNNSLVRINGSNGYGFYIQKVYHESYEILVDYKEYGLDYEDEEYLNLEEFLDSVDIDDFTLDF